MAFALGIISRLIKSDLELPPALYKSISIYLLLAIGLKGGVELSKTPFDQVVWPVAGTLFLGVLTPITAFLVLRYLGRFDMSNAAGIAAHYGSVSVVTFIAAISYVESLGLQPEGFLPTLVALLEIPGIVVALMIPLLAKSGGGSLKKAFHEVFTGSSIVLLLGGLLIGWIAGPEKFVFGGAVFCAWVSGGAGALCAGAWNHYSEPSAGSEKSGGLFGFFRGDGAHFAWCNRCVGGPDGWAECRRNFGVCRDGFERVVYCCAGGGSDCPAESQPFAIPYGFVGDHVSV